MKNLILLTLSSLLFLFSCTKKNSENIPEFEKPYRLTSDYEGIGKRGLIYVCHITNEFVSVIDPEKNELIGKIPAGKGTDGICFSPDRKTGYIANYNSYNLTIFNTADNKTIKTVVAGENPTTLLPIKNGKVILYSHQSSEGIWALDAEKMENFKRLKDCTGPLHFLEKENKIYQPQIFKPYIYIIDPESIEVVKKIETGGRPMDMTFIPAMNIAYLGNFDSSEVAKYDTKTDILVKKIKGINNPRGIASSPDGSLVYVTNVVDNTVTVIKTESDIAENVIQGLDMPVSVAFTGDGKSAYVANQRAATVSVIDTKSGTITKSISVAGNPIYIYIDK